MTSGVAGHGSHPRAIHLDSSEVRSVRCEERPTTRARKADRRSGRQVGQRCSAALEGNQNVPRLHPRQDGNGRELANGAAPHHRNTHQCEMDLMIGQSRQRIGEFQFSDELDVDTRAVKPLEYVMGTTRDVGMCRQPGRHVVMPLPGRPSAGTRGS